MNPKEFGVLNNLYGAISVQWGVVSPCSPKINQHFFCFDHIQGQFVDFALVC